MVSSMSLGLPIEERPYHQFWRSSQNAAWRPLVAAVLAAVGYLVAAMIAGLVVFIADPPKSLEGMKITPALFLANNLTLAALIPLVFGLGMLFLRQPARYMSSVVGRLRWRWLIKVSLVVLPIWLIQAAITLWLMWDTVELSIRPHTTAMIVIIVTTQVFQCAGEEYGFRGLLNRAVGAWIPGETLSFVCAGIVSSLFFMVSHGAGDLWLNLFYFIFGMSAAYMTWRTGGLEAAIAIHCVNNLLSLALVPFSDISDLFNRQSGAGSPWILLNMLVMIIATVLVVWMAKRDGLITRTAPGQGMIPPQGPYPVPYPVPQPMPGQWVQHPQTGQLVWQPLPAFVPGPQQAGPGPIPHMAPFPQPSPYQADPGQSPPPTESHPSTPQVGPPQPDR